MIFARRPRASQTKVFLTLKFCVAVTEDGKEYRVGEIEI